MLDCASQVDDQVKVELENTRDRDKGSSLFYKKNWKLQKGKPIFKVILFRYFKSMDDDFDKISEKKQLKGDF